MSKTKILDAIMGTVMDEPATPAKDGIGVEPGGYGLVMWQGLLGYYDDDGLNVEGKDCAIVYFGKPFRGDCEEIYHEGLTPATPEQVEAYRKDPNRFTATSFSRAYPSPSVH